MRKNHLTAAFVCLMACALRPQLAQAAEPTDAEKRGAAEAIYAQGSELMKRGSFSEACPKFEEVVKLQPNGIGARMTLADCYSGQRKFASAYTTYGQAASMSLLANQPDRAATAQEKAAELAPKLSKLTIVVPPTVASVRDLTIMRGGLVVTASLFNVAVAVDGGDYTIVADATGKKPFTRTVSVADEGANEQVTLAFEAVEAPDPKEPGGDQTIDSPVGIHPVRIGGIVAGSLGLTLAGVGIGLGVVRGQDADDHRLRFEESEADSDSDAYVAASDQAIVGWVLTGVGGAASIAGLAMVIAAPDGEANAEESKPAATFNVDLGLGSVSLHGTF